MFPGHLHVHTEYSLLDGMGSIEEYVNKSIEEGFKYLAVTDHGSTSGLYEAFQIEKKYNFPIIKGCEFYVESPSEDLKTGHLILCAKNNEGLADLFELQQLAYENMYYKPRLSKEMIREYGKKGNLICTTACVANHIHQYNKAGEFQLAKKEYVFLEEIFGEDLYTEIQVCIDEKQRDLYDTLIEKLDNPKLILTTDVHYTNKEDYDAHEVMLCIGTKQKMSDEKRFSMDNNYWLKSEQEMKSEFNEQYGINQYDEDLWEECCNNLEEAFEKCIGVTFDEKTDHLPKYKGMDNEEATVELEKQVAEGTYKKLIPRHEYNAGFRDDLAREIQVISDEGYSGYFLVVQEYCNWARENRIQVGDGRGSGAGSKVAYTIGITDVNPQKYDLLFDRFLSHGREPDFDVDFSDIDAVFEHLQNVYGKTNVARVGAFTRLTAKSATQKVMSAYGFKYKESRYVLDSMPDRLEFTLDEAINESRIVRDFMEENEHVRKAVHRLEGKIEHMSTHAGGVVICEGLTRLLPTLVRADEKDKLIIGLDKRDIEKLHHYKFDILGLSGLEVMANVYEYIDIDWHSVDFNDSNVYGMLQAGKVEGVFQLGNQRDKVVEQKPKNFEDLISINALIRPGVCDWKQYIYARNHIGRDEEMPEFMRCTHGLIVYQDQYEQLAREYAGWSIAYADKHLRKNKKITTDTELKEKWLSDTKERGYNEEEMLDLWDTIVNIVSHGYGFNRAHSTSYAVLSFKTAYCKYYYPKEFYSAYLSKYVDKPDRIKNIISLIKEEGIKLIHPDINKSGNKFVPIEEGILMPINAIKGVGGSAIWAINDIKPIKDFDDFMERRVKKLVRSTTITALIKAGAFDYTGESRYDLLCRYDISNKDTPKQPNYIYDYSAFGFYLSESPFEKYNNKSFSNCPDGGTFMAVMQIDDLKIRKDKKGRDMVFAGLTNNQDSIDAVIFATVWERSDVEEEDIVFVTGKRDKSKLLVDRIEKLNEYE